MAVIMTTLKMRTLGQSLQLVHQRPHFLAGEAISEVSSAESCSVGLPTESCHGDSLHPP